MTYLLIFFCRNWSKKRPLLIVRPILSLHPSRPKIKVHTKAPDPPPRKKVKIEGDSDKEHSIKVEPTHAAVSLKESKSKSSSEKSHSQKYKDKIMRYKEKVSVLRVTIEKLKDERLAKQEEIGEKNGRILELEKQLAIKDMQLQSINSKK